MKLEFVLSALLLNIDIEKAPENLQVELINLQCDIFRAREGMLSSPPPHIGSEAHPASYPMGTS
jgi:hypothetical protein